MSETDIRKKLHKSFHEFKSFKNKKEIFGITNELKNISLYGDNAQLLFIDYDWDIQERRNEFMKTTKLRKTILFLQRHIPFKFSYVIVETGRGYHMIILNPMAKTEIKKIYSLLPEDYICQMFIGYYYIHGSSVLRITKKYKNERFKIVRFVLVPEPTRKISRKHLELYSMLNNNFSSIIKFNGEIADYGIKFVVYHVPKKKKSKTRRNEQTA